jgi:hypothetical protein
MLKRVILIIVWTVAFFLGSAFVLGLATGVFIFVLRPSQQPQAWIGWIWLLVPWIFGFLGLTLALLGRLPGTGRSVPEMSVVE